MLFRVARFSSQTPAILSASILFTAAFPLSAAPPTGAAAPVQRRSVVTRPAAPPKAAPAPVAEPKPARVAPKKRPAPTVQDAPPVTREKPESSRETAPIAREKISPSSDTTGIPIFADAWPSEARPAPADLELKVELGRRSEALALFAKGQVAEDNADQEAMLAAYRRAVELDPSNAELAVKVAFELARRNDVSSGIQILKDSIKAAPKEPLPYIYLSQLYANYLKKPDLALSYAEQAVALAPGNFKSHLALYELHLTGGQKVKADAALAKALQSASTDPQYWTELGEHLQRLYLKDDGNCTPEQQEQMSTVYQKLASLAADDPIILAKVADYYVLSKQVNQAIPLYRRVLVARNGANDSLAVDVREKLARSLLVSGARDEAITAFENIAKASPQNFETHEVLGELYEQKGDFDEALKYYRHGLTLDASAPRNHLRLADVYRRAKRYDQAVELFKQAQQKFPDLPRITYGLALTLSQAQRHEEALAAFASAQTDAEKRDEEMLDAEFYFCYGAAAEQAGEVEKAVQLLKQSIDLDPKGSTLQNPGNAYNYLGYMWADRGERLDEAGELIRKALEMEPENGAYLDSLGWYLFKKGDTQRALDELLRAQDRILREDKKDDPTVLDHIADAYAKLGKTADALGCWQKALALEPEDKKLVGRITEKLEAAKQKVTSGTPPLPAPQP